MPYNPGYDGGTYGRDYTSAKPTTYSKDPRFDAQGNYIGQNAANVNATADLFRSDPVRAAYSYGYTNPSLMSVGGSYQMPSTPSLPGRPGSGGGGSGGGGGGGGGGLTAEQQAALLRMGQNPYLQQFTPYNQPAYQQWNPAAMDMGIFDAARGRIGTAAEADRERVRQAYAPLLALLKNAKNPMSNAQWATTPQLQQAYQRIMGNTGPLQQVDQENAYSMNSDQAFGNLMALLAAQEERNMSSRVNQGYMDQATGLSNVDALSSGMLGGVEMSQLRAAEEDRLRRDQIAREEARYGYEQQVAPAFANWQMQNQVNQSNVGIQNDALQALLSLIPGITQKDLLAQLVGAGPAGQTLPQVT